MLSRFCRAVRLANPGSIAIADAKQNGGSYDFIIEKKGEGQDYTNFGWPTEQRFWDDLMYNSSQWGLFMYEQDWLDTEYDNIRDLHGTYLSIKSNRWSTPDFKPSDRNYACPGRSYS